MLVTVNASNGVRYFPEGCHEITEQIIIPRQRLNVEVPGPYLGDWANQYPAGKLWGRDTAGTVLRFDPSITGALIKTELASQTNVGAWWNSNNTGGDTDLRAYSFGTIEGFTIDGRAELKAYPYGSTPGDIHGRAHPVRAHGIHYHGYGGKINNLNLFQIPGTGIKLQSPGGAQWGAYGIYDWPVTEVHDVRISHAVNGIEVGLGLADTKVHDVLINNIALDGIVTWGGVLANSHVYGADRSLVIGYATRCYDNYMEAARIGTEILSTAGGSVLHGLDIGPGTCTTGVLMGARTHLHGLCGAIGSSSYPNAVGVEVSNAVAYCEIFGELAIHQTATGLVVRGDGTSANLHFGGVSGLASGRIGIKVYSVPNPPYNNLQCNRLDLTASGYSTAGTYIDLSSSELNIAHRNGENYDNEFHVIMNGTNAAPVIYPGGGSTYNLVAGNRVFINGRPQHDNAIIGVLSLNTPTELTIASGAVTATASYHTIDTEADAASDDLTTINGGAAGDVLIIRAVNSSRTVSVTEAGNIKLSSSPFDMDNAEDTLSLICDGTNWLETARSNNGA